MARSRYTMAFDHHNMVKAPTATSTVRVVWNSEDGVMDCYGTGSAPTTANTYAEGCIYRKLVAAGVSIMYINYGTYASPDFREVLNANNVITEIEKDHLASVAGTVGASPLVWDEQRMLEVMLDPRKGFYHFDDFTKNSSLTAGAVLNGMLLTQTHSHGAVAGDPSAEGGILKLDTGASTATDGPTLQLTDLQVKPQAGTKIVMEWRAKISLDDVRLYMGLANDDTTDYVSDDSVNILKSQCGFFRDSSCDSTDDLSTISSKVDAEDINDTVIEAATNTYHTYAIVIDGISTVKFYWDGVLMETVSSADNIPIVAICPIFQINCDASTQAYMYIDWLRVMVYDADGSCRIAS